MGVEKVPEEAEGGRKRSYKVTMTTLRAAPTRHRHTENLSEKRRRYLPKQHPEMREGWGQKTTMTTAQKQCEQNDWLCEGAVKSQRPSYTPRLPHIRLVVETSAQHCLAFNLP